MHLIAILRDFLAHPDPSASGKLYITAVACLGRDASPDDIVPDEFGCAESVNAVHQKAFGASIGGGGSTYLLYQALLKHPRFLKVDVPGPGDVIISPSGYGNGKLKNGHVGIMGKADIIMSNDSDTGMFLEKYTLESWRDRYAIYGGYPVLFFKRI